MLELILFREAFFYVAYSGVQFALVYIVHLTTVDTTMSLARLACAVQFVWFACLLVLMFVTAGLFGIDVDSIEAMSSDMQAPPDTADKKKANETTLAACDGVLLASTAVTAGVFIALLAGTIVCMHGPAADACVAMSGGQHALGVMSLLLVMQAQLLFSSAITANIQRREREVPPVLVLGTLVFAYATAEVILVLPSMHSDNAWLHDDTVLVWLVFYVLQVVYLMCGGFLSVYYSSPQNSTFDKVVYLWLPAVVSLLLSPALFSFTLFDVTSAGLLFAPLVTVGGLCLRYLVLDVGQDKSAALKQE
jgi:hypothetical protein